MCWPYALLVLALLLPNLLLLPYYAAHDGLPYAMAQFGMSCTLLALPLLFVPFRRWLLLGGLALLLYPLELASLVSIGEPINFGVYWSIRSTSRGEALGQIRVYILPAAIYLLAMSGATRWALRGDGGSNIWVDWPGASAWAARHCPCDSPRAFTPTRRTAQRLPKPSGFPRLCAKAQGLRSTPPFRWIFSAAR